MTIGTINIFGIIGDVSDYPNVKDGTPQTTFLDVVRQVERQKDAEKFHVSIDSPGGLVEEGDQIYDYLKALKKPIRTFARKVCASQATKIFMVGDERVIHPGCEFMIHNPWGEMRGDANKMENYAAELRQLEKNFIDFYAKATGTSKEAIKPLMDKETVLTAEQALELGFATEIFNDELKAVAFSNKLTKKQNPMGQPVTKKEMDGMFDKFAANIKKLLGKSGTKALMVQDVNGKELDFKDLEEGQTPSVDDMATVDGDPATGEYTLANGTVYVFDAGKLTEVREPEGGDDAEEMAQLKESNQQLETEVNNLKAALKAEKKEKRRILASVSELEDELDELKEVAGTFALSNKRQRQKGGDPNGGGDPKPRTL